MPQGKVRTGSIRIFEGAELVPNGDMELDSGWTNQGTPTTNERSTTHYAGTYSRRFVTDGAGEGIYSDAFATTGGQYCRISAMVLSTGNSVNIVVNMLNGDGAISVQYSQSIPQDIWTRFAITHIDAGGGGAAGKLTFFCASGRDICIDNASVKEFTVG
jgi:hypothetical protein